MYEVLGVAYNSVLRKVITAGTAKRGRTGRFVPVCCVYFSLIASDGLLLFVCINPQEPAATARGPLHLLLLHRLIRVPREPASPPGAPADVCASLLHLRLLHCPIRIHRKSAVAAWPLKQ